jgi:apolipoprotein N-acyltransferase
MGIRTRLLLLAASAGVLAALFWLPFGMAPALPLALVLALRGLRLVRNTRDAVLFGLVLGAARHAVGGHYIFSLVTYSPLAFVIGLLDIVYILPFAVVEACGALWIERRTGVPRTVTFPMLYCVLEWTRTLGDLSVPSDLFVHGFGGYTGWLSWTAWTGPYFLSLLAFGVAALVDLAIETRQRRGRAWALVAAAAVLWVAPPLTDLAASSRDSATQPFRVGIVQPSFRVEEKLNREEWPRLNRVLTNLTRKAAEGVDLVVWPESGRPGAVIWKEGEPFSDPQMEDLARQVGVPILYGCEIARVTADRQLKGLYNAAALARADGTPGDWYGKQQLLPFVEGVPFAKLIGWDPSKAKRPKGSYLTLLGNFYPGPKPTVFTVGEARIGVLICYEGLYPQLARQYRLAGANVLCAMTNDAWWGRTIFPKWHARTVSARAREVDLPVIRAANSGVSSVLDSSGRVLAQTGLFEVTTFQMDLHPSSAGPTFYARTGDLVVWVLLAVLGALVVLGLARPRRSEGR